MNYLIGDVAKLTGMSIEGIRKYEKQGIITSKRNTNNQYRYYNYLDITSLVRSRSYRALGFSIQEVAELINQKDIAGILEAFELQKDKIDSETRILEMKRLALEERIDEISRIDQALNRISIIETPAFYRFEFSKNGVIDLSENIVNIFQQWIACVPFIHISTRYYNNDSYGGFLIKREHAEMFDISIDERVSYLPQSLCIQTCVEETKTAFAQTVLTDRLRQFALEHRFMLDENIFGSSVISLHKSSDYIRYRKIMAKIYY